MTRTARARRPLLPAVLWLTGATLLLVVANGRWVWSPAAWLAPVFLLSFLESRPRVTGLSIGFAVQLVAFFVNWQGMIPVPGAWYYLVAAIYALFYYLPYVVHRLVAPRFVGLAWTLVLPSAWVTIELLFQALVTPYGSWSSIAYTQVDRLWLLQLASLTGTAGISFLIVWSASVMAWLWKHRASLARVRRGLAVYVIAMGLVLAWGGYRLHTAERSPPPTVQLAGITPSAPLRRDLISVMGRLRSQGLLHEATAMAQLAESASRLNEDLFARTARAAREGAALVVWSEHAARVLPQTEVAFLDDGGRVARDDGVGLVLGIGSWNPSGTPPFENKVTAVRPDGTTAWTYHKARPIAGNESGLIVSGSTGVATLDAAFGRIGVVICHDLDFPRFVRSAGLEEVDLLIAPSSDWDEIATMHHRMAVVRAVENGCALFRPCADGISSAVDPFGRVVEMSRDDAPEGLIFQVDVPLYRVATLYPSYGDWFGVASGALIVLLCGLGGWRRSPVKETNR